LHHILLKLKTGLIFCMN